MRFAPLAALLALLAPAAFAQPSGLKATLVTPALLADAEAVAPGSSFTLGVRLRMKAQWHTYWANPGESGEATTVKFTGPAGFTFGAIQWPLPHKITTPGGFSYGYEDEVLLLVPVTVAKDAAAGPATIEAAVNWLACNEDTCVEGKGKVKTTVEVAGQVKPANAEVFERWRKQLPAQAADAAAVAKIEQPAGQSAFTVRWAAAAPPKKVEWFPLATPAVSIENVTVRHEGEQTRVEFKSNVFKADAIPNNQVDGVLVFEDASGNRKGIPAPVTIK